MTRVSGSVLTAAEMRGAEQAAVSAGTPLSRLMDRAGAALADAVWRYGGARRVLVICGPGNNGGDGYVAARLLADRGLQVSVAASGAPGTELARDAASSWTGKVAALGDARPAPVLIDALFGTGISRPLSAEIAGPLHALSTSADLIVAADLPSGLGTDDGSDFGAARADLTIAFGAFKPAHFLQPAAGRCGIVQVVDIGIEAVSGTRVIVRPMLPAPTASDHKYTRGFVAVIGGEMPGASALSTLGAARAGAGYVVLSGEHADLPHAIIRHPSDALETLLQDSRIGSVVIGPGLGKDESARKQLMAVLQSRHNLILDADALSLLAEDGLDQLRNRKTSAILTPHAGEFVRLFGEGSGSKIDRARDVAERANATIVFKGTDTVIASPDGRVTLAPPASPWLSTAGTGDVLSGIAGAMFARKLDAHDAACAAVWLHAEAARRAGPAMIADDIALHLAAALADCL